MFTYQNGGIFFSGNSSYNVGIFSRTADLVFQANGSERMRLTSAGNLIINESAQVAYGGNTPKLEVLSASIESTDADGGSLALIGSTNTAGAGGALVMGSLFQTGAWGTFGRVRGSKNNGTAGDYGGGIAFDTRPNLGNLTQRMLITSAGNVGIGTSSPVLPLVVSSSGAAGLEFDSSGLIQSYNRATSAYQNLSFDAALMVFRPSGTERMRINSIGHLLLGVSASVDGRMTIAADTGNSGAISTTNNGLSGYYPMLNYYNGGLASYVAQSASGFTIVSTSVLSLYAQTVMQLSAGGTERARIDSSGRLYVNTTDNGYTTAIKLSVTAAAGEGAFLFKNDAGNNQWTGWVWNTATTGDNLFINFMTEAGGTNRGSITYNRAGGLLSFNTTSDYRAKDILGQVTDAGATIDALKVYNGKMKGATIARPMLVAHEAQEVVPYAVTGEKDAVNEDGTDKYQQMDHQSLIPLLIAEIQSLRARVAQLEGK
jgi:hypothetical protein